VRGRAARGGTALHDLLRFGPDADVLASPALRDRKARAATGLAELYG
jgi:hypothetical protein